VRWNNETCPSARSSCARGGVGPPTTSASCVRTRRTCEMNRVARGCTCARHVGGGGARLGDLPWTLEPCAMCAGHRPGASPAGVYGASTQGRRLRERVDVLGEPRLNHLGVAAAYSPRSAESCSPLRRPALRPPGVRDPGRGAGNRSRILAKLRFSPNGRVDSLWEQGAVRAPVGMSQSAARVVRTGAGDMYVSARSLQAHPRREPRGRRRAFLGAALLVLTIGQRSGLGASPRDRELHRRQLDCVAPSTTVEKSVAQ